MRLSKKQFEDLIRLGEDQTISLQTMNNKMSMALGRVGQAMVDHNRERLIEDGRSLVETLRELAKSLEEYADTKEALVSHWESGGAMTLEECEDKDSMVN